MRKTRSDNTSGFPGVVFGKGRWEAEIRRGGRRLFYGRFDSIEEAQAARQAALIRLGIPERNMVKRAGVEPPPVPGARWIPLTGKKFALVDDADFALVSERNWYFRDGYAKSKDMRTKVIVSLQAFLMRPPEGFEVDHIDRDGLNCRRGNMRIATHAQNLQNVARKRTNASGFIGVHWDKRCKRWVAQAKANGEHVFLGRHASAEEAARVRDAWVLEHHGSFATLNFPAAKLAPKGDESGPAQTP
jgi:hypothetical protein